MLYNNLDIFEFNAQNTVYMRKRHSGSRVDMSKISMYNKAKVSKGGE